MSYNSQETLILHWTNLNLTLTSFEKLPMLRPYACTAAQCPNTTVKTCGRNSIIKIMVLLGEPYFDVNFNEVLYLTDTGRTWENQKISVRDHVDSRFSYDISSSNDLIENLKEVLTDQLCSTFIRRDGRIILYFGVRNWFSKN